jgi:hypothetical protein
MIIVLHSFKILTKKSCLTVCEGQYVQKNIGYLIVITYEVRITMGSNNDTLMLLCIVFRR